MRITAIEIQNLLGIIDINVAPASPVTVFAGDNYAGKSSIREAIKTAFLGMPERVLKKKDFDQLVHDDSQAGSISVEFEDGTAVFAAPKGDQEIRHDFTMARWEPIECSLPYCLDTETFARVNDDERRQLLFTITGASAKTADIVARLKARGVGEVHIETVTPLLRSGFPAAAKYAEERCREAKGAWKAVTGEAYGHVKAETWEAVSPEVDTTAIEQLKTKSEILKGKIGTEQTKLGAAEQRLKAWLTHSVNQEADRKAFARLEAVQAKLERDQAELAQWQEKVQTLEQLAGAGPRVGLVHDLARALEYLLGFIGEVPASEDDKAATGALASYEAQYGPIGAQGDSEAAAKLPEAVNARDLMQRSVDNDKRDLEAARAAGARLQQQVEKGSEAEVESIRTILAGYQQDVAASNEQLEVLQADQRAAATAADNTTKALAHHQAAQQWQIAIDALSPAGIPAEILATALDPFNQTLLELSDTFGWPRVALDADMMITVFVTEKGRGHGQLSKSEKWRANTIISLAIAHISGLRFVALDEVDILNLTGRVELIDGLDALAEDDYFDTALLFGTFKKLPNFERFPHVTGLWVEVGRIAQPALEEVAA